MALTLYGTKGSGVAAIEAALEMMGLVYRRVEACSWVESEGLAELRGVNPIAQVPTLAFDDGTVMTESAAILIELGLRHPQALMLSADPVHRAQQIRGLVYIGANCYAGIGILDYPERWFPEPDAAVREAMQRRGKARLHELWAIFADQFPATPWLSGERIGALDILAATVSRWSGTRPAMAQQRPAFHDLLLRIEAEPVIAAVWTRHWPRA
ncbi:glutathione S-transferase [soil metagenome]